MKLARRTSFVLALGSAFVAASLALADGPEKNLGSKAPAPASSPGANAKTLNRTEDSVVLTGADLPHLTGRHKNQIRALVLRKGAFEPIPFQIDEKNADGQYCWDHGDPQIQKERAGIFEAKDELCFMSRDAGDRADPAVFPQNCDGWHEVELEDPLTHAKGWVYLMKFYGRPPAASNVRYVSIDMHDDGVITWRGDRFLTSNAKTPENACRATIIQFAPIGSDDATKGQSVIDCSKVALTAHWAFITVTRNSADVRIRLGGYLAGPVRIVAQNIVEVKLALGIWLSAPDSLLTLYPNCTTMPTNVKLPVTLNEDDYSNYRLPIDLSQRAQGWKFYNDHNPDPVTIDGKMDEKEKKLDLTWPQWNCAFGPEGALITKFILDPRSVRPTNKLLYIDDLTQAIEPEFEPGSWGTFGYEVDLSGMKSGLYSGNYIIWYVAAPFRQGDEKRFLDTVDNPIKTTIR